MSYTKKNPSPSNQYTDTTLFQAFDVGIADGSPVNTIAELKGLSGLTDGETRQVLGYYAANDGGGGPFRYNSGSSATDNAGTIIAPNAGSGRWERIHDKTHLSVLWFGAKADNVQDDASKIAATIAAADASGIGHIVFPWGAAGVYRCDTKIVNLTMMPTGLHFIAQGKHSIAWEGDAHVEIRYTGASVCWDIRPPVGLGYSGDWLWRDFFFRCTDAAATMFQFGDMTRETISDSDATAPQGIDKVQFERCEFWGNPVDVAATGDGIRAIRTFHLRLDEGCNMRNWRRAVWLKGCDNALIRARISGNVVHIYHEGRTTFGNSLVVQSRYFGPTYNDGLESTYKIYLDNVSHTSIYNPFFELESNAHLYINGYSTSIYTPWFGGPAQGTAPPRNRVIHLGPDAAETKIYNPTGFVGTDAVIFYDDPTVKVWTETTSNQSPKLVVYSPEGRLEDRIFKPHPRLTVHSDRKREGYLPHAGVTGAGGTSQTQYTMTPFNMEHAQRYNGYAYPATAADAAALGGWAFSLPAISGGVEGSRGSVMLELIAGRDIGLTEMLRITIRYRLASSPTGTLNRVIEKTPGGDVSSALPNSTSYLTEAFTYNMAADTWTAGQSLRIGALNVSNVAAYVASITIAVSPGPTFRWSTAAPTTGYHTQGERVYNPTPTAAGFDYAICVASGTPGTWKSVNAPA